MADQKTTQLTELTDVALADVLPIVDDAAGTPVTMKTTVQTLLESINNATEETTIDGAADFLVVYDTSATAVRKMLPDNLPVSATVLLVNGSRALSANWDAGAFSITAETFVSDVVTGTAPLTVASTTVVANLNADLLDGQEGTYYRDAGNLNAGTVAHERGGLEADVSAYDGLVRITGGATSAVTVTSFALTVLDDADAATVRATIGAASSAEVAAISSSYSRRQGVIARVDNTAAPPTEVSGDRYLLDDTGASHANWDGAAINDIVEFDGTSWVATSPTEGWIVYNDATDLDWLYIDDGSPGWQSRAVLPERNG